MSRRPGGLLSMAPHPPPIGSDWAPRLLRSPAVLIAAATFVVLGVIAMLLMRDQASQRFEVAFAREATAALQEVESQARLTSQDLWQTRAFVASTDPTPEEWYAYVRETTTAGESWLDSVAVVERVDVRDLDRLKAQERAAGRQFVVPPPRPGASELALVTRVNDGDDALEPGIDLFAVPAARAALERSAKGDQAAIGLLPVSTRQLLQVFGDRLGWDEEIGSMVALLPIGGSETGLEGWLAAEFQLEHRLAPILASGNLGLAIAFDSDVEWTTGERLELAGRDSEKTARLAETRAFETPLLTGTVHVWSRGEPALGVAEALTAGVIATIGAGLTGLVVLLLSRAIGLRRRLGESERELQVDPLTSLKSRVGLERALSAKLEAGSETGTGLAVMLLDINRFKVVNDSLGHAVGDDLLRAVGGRLRSGTSSGDVLGRFGGDEFVVIAPGVEDPKRAEAIAHRLAKTLDAPIEVGGRSLSVRASIGVAMASSTEGVTPDELIRDADAAMYAAKRDGLDVRVFDASLRSRALDRLAMEEAVRDALEHGWLRLEYQPIVTITTGSLAGVEALVRMDHPTLGPLPPDRFLPVAREVGLMGRLGAEVIRMAVADARHWNERFPDEPPLRISVNLAESQAADPGLVPFVLELLEEHGVEAPQLCFELSEGALVENLRECVPVLKQLVALGVQLSVDDFGTGRSSLAHLRLLSFVSEVKIDRTFMAGLGGVGSDEDIVGAIVDLAAALQARVVAEGVETLEQWERLAALGVSHAQGFFFARPQGADAVDDWADKHGRGVGDRFGGAALQSGRAQ